MSARDIYPAELLQLAVELVQATGHGQPRTVRLRCGVSTAYYAVFHRISRDVSWQLLGSFRTQEARDFTRWLTHADLRNLAREVGTPSDKMKPVLLPPSADLALLCDSFLDLQAARHEADCSHDFAITNAGAQELVGLAEAAVEAATRMRRSHDASYSRFLRLAVGALQIAKKR